MAKITKKQTKKKSKILKSPVKNTSLNIIRNCTIKLKRIDVTKFIKKETVDSSKHFSIEINREKVTIFYNENIEAEKFIANDIDENSRLHLNISISRNDGYRSKLRCARQSNKPTILISVVKLKNEHQVLKANTFTNLTTIWKNCKKNVDIEKFAVGDLVLAKMKSYSPWPSQILSVDKKRVNVIFFGYGNKGSVPIDEIVPYDYNDSTIPLFVALLKKKILHYSKAVREVEIKLNISEQNSITNQLSNSNSNYQNE